MVTGVRARLRGDDGANAVEFALVLPLLVMLIFGAITAGLALNTRQQLDHAGREGARFAATLPQGSVGAPACDPPSAPSPRSWHECVRDHVLGTSVGAVDLATGGICVSHVPDDGVTPTSSVLYGDIATDDGSAASTPLTSPVSTSQPCLDENPALTGPRVQVKVVAPGLINAVFVRTPVFDLTARAVARYEED